MSLKEGSDEVSWKPWDCVVVNICVEELNHLLELESRKPRGHPRS